MTLRGQALHKMHSGALSSHKFELKLSDVAAFFLKTSQFLYSGEPLQATPSLTELRMPFLVFSVQEIQNSRFCFWSLFGVGSNSQVAKDAKEQEQRHAKNLWPDAHLPDKAGLSENICKIPKNLETSCF